MSGLEAELAEAMRLARRGNRRAYALVLSRLAAVLRPAIARRLGAAAGEAEDVVQDVLLAIHLKNATWDESKPLLPWAHAIAAHKAIDTVRKRQRDNRVLAREVSADDLADIVPGPEPEPALSMSEIERQVAALPQRQQSVVRAISLEGGTVASAAASLRLSEGAIRVAFHRGLKSLKGVAAASGGSRKG